jgi:hypothetical protein
MYKITVHFHENTSRNGHDYQYDQQFDTFDEALRAIGEKNDQDFFPHFEGEGEENNWEGNGIITHVCDCDGHTIYERGESHVDFTDWTESIEELESEDVDL